MSLDRPGATNSSAAPWSNEKTHDAAADQIGGAALLRRAEGPYVCNGTQSGNDLHAREADRVGFVDGVAGRLLDELCVRASCRHVLRMLDAGTELRLPRREARPVPYLAVIGAKEAADDHVALRLRDGHRLDPQPISDVITRISTLIGAHSTDLWAAATS